MSENPDKNNTETKEQPKPESQPPSSPKLAQKFAFWFRISEDMLFNKFHKIITDKNQYESEVKKIAEFDNINDFWLIFQHLRKPDSCKPGIEFQMFKDPIKPIWEDEGNKDGGRASIKLRKDFTTIIWEEVIFAIIGGVLPEEVRDEVNGVVVSSRKDYNILQVWFRSYSDKLVADLEQVLRDLLQIPDEVPIEFRQFFAK